MHSIVKPFAVHFFSQVFSSTFYSKIIYYVLNYTCFKLFHPKQGNKTAKMQGVTGFYRIEEK